MRGEGGAFGVQLSCVSVFLCSAAGGAVGVGRIVFLGGCCAGVV